MVWKYHTYFCVPGTQQVSDKYCKSELKSWERLFPVFSFLSTFIWPPLQLWAIFLTPELKHIHSEGIMDSLNIIIHLNLNVWLRDPRSWSDLEVERNLRAHVTWKLDLGVLAIFDGCFPAAREQKGRTSFWQM